MKTHTRTLKRPKNLQNHIVNKKKGIKIMPTIIIGVLMIFTACISAARISSKTESLNKENVKLIREIKKLHIEIDNYEIKREKLETFPHIMGKIQEFGLFLSDPKAEQVKNMKLVDNKRFLLTEGRRLQISQR